MGWVLLPLQAVARLVVLTQFSPAAFIESHLSQAGSRSLFRAW